MTEASPCPQCGSYNIRIMLGSLTVFCGGCHKEYPGCKLKHRMSREECIQTWNRYVAEAYSTDPSTIEPILEGA